MKPSRHDKKVQLISSGEVEWIEQLRELKSKEVEIKEIKKQNHELDSKTKKGKFLIRELKRREFYL